MDVIQNVNICFNDATKFNLVKYGAKLYITLQFKALGKQFHSIIFSVSPFKHLTTKLNFILKNDESKITSNSVVASELFLKFCFCLRC